MKTKLLKKLRLKVLDKYDVRNWSHIPCCQDKPWRIGCGINTTLSEYKYTTKEEAIKGLKLLWHEEASKYLWEHKLERKRNKYPW